MSIRENWQRVIDAVELRHPQRDCVAQLSLSEETWPVLTVRALNVLDTIDDKPKDWLTISSVRLTIWPGWKAACAWLACAWAGYVAHEALELCTFKHKRPIIGVARGERLINPHSPSHEAAWDKGLRDGFPPELTSVTIMTALELFMDRTRATALVLCTHDAMGVSP